MSSVGGELDMGGGVAGRPSDRGGGVNEKKYHGVMGTSLGEGGGFSKKKNWESPQGGGGMR